MLRPHHREDAELDEIGLATERFQDALIFLGREAVVGDDLGRDAGSFDNVHRGALAVAKVQKNPRPGPGV